MLSGRVYGLSEGLSDITLVPLGSVGGLTSAGEGERGIWGESSRLAAELSRCCHGAVMKLITDCRCAVAALSPSCHRHSSL